MTPQEYSSQDSDEYERKPPRTIERIVQERRAAAKLIRDALDLHGKIKVANVCGIKKYRLQHIESQAQRLDSEAYERLWNFLNGEG